MLWSLSPCRQRDCVCRWKCEVNDKCADTGTELNDTALVQMIMNTIHAQNTPKYTLGIENEWRFIAKALFPKIDVLESKDHHMEATKRL